MNEFQFKPEIAELYGVNEAIFLHSLSFWITKNRSNRANFHEGRYWSYDTYKSIAERFPFWTPRQIERIIANCEEKGAILADNFNKDKTDRKKWYTLAGNAESIYFPETVSSISPNSEMTPPQGVEAGGEDTPPISPNSEMQNTETDAPICQTVNCIKETVTNQLVSPYKPPRGQGGAKGALPESVVKRLAEYVGADEELGQAMSALMGIRLENKKAKNTDAGIKGLLMALDKHSGGDREKKIQILLTSAAGCYIGVFPLRGQYVDRRAEPREEEERIVI